MRKGRGNGLIPAARPTPGILDRHDPVGLPRGAEGPRGRASAAKTVWVAPDPPARPAPAAPAAAVGADKTVWVPEAPVYEACVVCGGTDHPAWRCPGWDALNREARIRACRLCCTTEEPHLHGTLLVVAGDVKF